MSGFGTTPVSTTSLSANQFPVSAVAVPGAAGGNLTALEGGPATTDSNGNSLAPAAMYVYDGNNVNEGATTDAAVTGDSAGSMSAKLRGINKILAAVWDNVNNLLHVNLKQVGGANVALGQNTMAASVPVALASNQSAVPVSVNALPAGSNVIGGVELVDSGGSNKASISAGGALKVDGSAVTQPVSGTFWQATQPVSGTVTETNSSGIKSDLDSIKTDVGTLIDTFGSATTISAATTFSGVPTISQLAANSSASLANPGNQSTFTVAIEVSSAFTGTISFYGEEADGSSLQVISAHLRGSTTIATSSALNMSSATNQVWSGNCATFKAIYVVCTAFTSGTATVQIASSSAPYAVSVSNTVNTLDTNSAAMKSDLDSIATNTSNTATSTSTIAGAVSSSKMAVKAAAGDFADGAITTLGTEADAAWTLSGNATIVALLKKLDLLLQNIAYDNTNELKASLYVKTTSPGDTVLAVGQATMANSLPVAVASNQGAVPVGPAAGTAFDTNAGTAGANTLRTQAGGSATGTKSNVAGSASSVTILASNTSRKGAIIYNDSTAVLYLDLSGGTAASTSYSVQLPANAYFELPGPNVYNGAITGIWSSATGNARVTEWT